MYTRNNVEMWYILGTYVSGIASVIKSGVLQQIALYKAENILAAVWWEVWREKGE